jgi:hypothetical protein
MREPGILQILKCALQTKPRTKCLLKNKLSLLVLSNWSK